MSRPLTSEQREARIIALEEAADHLDQSWTDDPVEREQGNVIAQQLRRRAERIALGVGA